MNRTALLLLGAAIALVLAGAWLCVHNPSVADRPSGDPWTCRAPYDIVLNHASEGGLPDDSTVFRRCREAGWALFATGTTFGAFGAGLAITALTWEIRRRRTPPDRPVQSAQSARPAQSD